MSEPTSGVIEQGDCWILPLAEARVTRCCVDYGFTIDFAEAHPSTSIRIDAAFHIKSHEGDEFGPAPSSFADGISLVGKVVDAAVAWKTGKLELRFTDGTALSSEADGEYEAWNAAGKGFLIVCMPSGGLSVWHGRR